MNASDKLQLIRALEEREASHKRRSNWLAWGSVLLAAVVLAAMILAGRWELARIQRRVTEANTTLATVKAKTDDAFRKLQTLECRGSGTSTVESVVDDLLEAKNAGSPAPPSVGPESGNRTAVIEQLFDSNAAVRVKAYNGLLPLYKDDQTLVPEILKVAREHPQNANGIYNALVVLSHMNRNSLRRDRQDIEAFAKASQSIGPRVSDRAQKLLERLPK
jgi:cell division protein FtsL